MDESSSKIANHCPSLQISSGHSHFPTLPHFYGADMATSSLFPTLQHFYGADMAASSFTSKEQAWLEVATLL